MRKEVIIGLYTMFVFTFLGVSIASASVCDLQVTLLNQDPYPAVLDDYVQVVFQIKGMENAECGEVVVELLESYPFKFDPNFMAIQTKKSGTFSSGYSSNWIVPYRVRIDSSAIDGSSDIELSYSIKNSNVKQIKSFPIEIQEVRADFKVIIRSYDYSTNRMTLDIINTAKSDVKSLILLVPKQENIRVFGGNKIIVGDLASNDYTSTDFVAKPSDGNIKIEIEYTDKIGERRSIEKEIVFDSSYFEHTKPSGLPRIRNLIIVGITIGLVAWWFLKKKKKKKK